VPGGVDLSAATAIAEHAGTCTRRAIGRIAAQEP
jgi:hypothetical protein